MAYSLRYTVDSPPPDPTGRPERTRNSPDIQEINEDIRQTHKIYHFQNCGTVSVDSFNARGVRTENCGNNIPRVTYHHPRIIGNEKAIHSQSPAISDGPQNATSSPTAPTSTETAKSNFGNVHLLRNSALSPAQFESPQPISQSHFSGDHTHHNMKHLEQLLDSSLATVAVIQISGNTLTDVLTPRAYETVKALYALAALDTAALSTKPRGGSPNRSTFPDIGNEYQGPYSGSLLPPFPNSSPVIPFTGKIHISISVNYVMLFLWAGWAAVSFLVASSNSPHHCEEIKRCFLKQGI